MTGPIYSAPAPSDFAPPVVLDGFTLLYHRPSGQTHMLAEPVPEILAALALGDAGAAEILNRLVHDHGIIDSEGEAERVIAARLSELAEIGLIRSI